MRTFVPGASVVHTHSFGGSNEGSEVLLEDDVVKITAVLLHSSAFGGTGTKKSKSFLMLLALQLMLLEDLWRKFTHTAFCRGSSYSLHHFFIRESRSCSRAHASLYVLK